MVFLVGTLRQKGKGEEKKEKEKVKREGKKRRKKREERRGKNVVICSLSTITNNGPSEARPTLEMLIF